MTLDLKPLLPHMQCSSKERNRIENLIRLWSSTYPSGLDLGAVEVEREESLSKIQRM